MHDEPPPSSEHSTILTLTLAFLLGAGILCSLIVVTGGLFLYLIPTVGGIAALGYLHYLLWGRFFKSEDTEPEDET